MKLCVNQADISPVKYDEYDYIPLLGSENGCLAGCRTGLLAYSQMEYKQGGVHEDQEGFYVLEGTGHALVGESEFPLSPGSCFIVPPGLYHSIKRDAACDSIKLFFFHAAV
jgi:gentisate 1,2-dioxygenase